MKLYEENPVNMSSPNLFCLRWNNHQSTLICNLSNLYNTNAFTDVVLACEDGDTIKAHRLVLSACSPFFENLLMSTQPSQSPIIVLKDVKKADMKALLSYMYFGQVNVDHDDLSNLLKVAESLQIRGLTGGSISTENCKSNDIPQAQNLSQHPRQPSTPPNPTATDLRTTQNVPTTSSSSDPIIPMGYSEMSNRRNDLSSEPIPKFKPYLNDHHSPRPRSPTSHYPTPPYSSLRSYMPHHRPDSRNEMKDIREDHRDISETRTGSPQIHPEDLRDPRRPLSIIPPTHPHLINGPDSHPLKRKRLNDSIMSPNPLLQNPLAHQHPGFNPPDMPSIISSMLPTLPGLFQSSMQRFLPDVRDVREHNESHFGGITIKKDLMPDEDSRSYSDVSREDEQEKLSNSILQLSNGSYFPDYSNYPIDPNNSTNYNHFAPFGPAPKPEWKRYKQYTKTDLNLAIEAVKSGQTALQASRKYKVPSRTLYDKIKKLGINSLVRKIPSKKLATTDLENGNESLENQPENFLINKDSDQGSVHDLSLALKKEQPDNEPIPGTSPRENNEEMPTSRGSFSLVQHKLFSSNSPAPLDLTDSESIIPNRTKIEDQA